MNVQQQIRLARPSDVIGYATHVVGHLTASGRDREIHYAPVEAVNRDEIVANADRRWRTPLEDPGWGRSWIVVEPRVDPPGPSERVTGHLDVRNDALPARSHRATMAIGLEPEVRGKRLGEALSLAALEWLREHTKVEIVDLGVFSHNPAARALYMKLGFREIGFVRDAFRLSDGTRIDDILMTLTLRR